MDREIFLKLVFKHYNRAKKSGAFDLKRLNKALGIALSEKKLRQAIETYHSTVNFCRCPDAINRGSTCKHRIACMILARVYQDAQKLWLNIDL